VSGDAVIMEREFAHRPEKVWRAITQSALIAEWLASNDFEARVGHRFTFRSQPQGPWNGITEGEVLAVEPPSRLVYSWLSTGGEGIDTVVELTLSPTMAGTRLRMAQTGFREDQAQNRQGAEFGWRRFLVTLGQVLDRGD
jgi:uncharacterized protein YndB with AHSA1/START domain